MTQPIYYNDPTDYYNDPTDATADVFLVLLEIHICNNVNCALIVSCM